MTCDRQRMNQVAACLRRCGRNPVRTYLDHRDPDLIQIDPDSFTQKLLQTSLRNPLIYRVILRQGPDHCGIWRVSRLVKGGVGSVGRNSGGDVVNHDGHVANHVVNLSGKKLGKELGKELGKDIPRNCRALYDLISVNGDITLVEMAGRLGLSEERVRKQVNKLVELGLVKRVGGRRFGHWEVVA